MKRQQTIMLSHYTNAGTGRREHTVLFNGSPMIRETEDAARAEEVARNQYRVTIGYPSRPVVLLEWDGDTDEERELERKTN